MTVIGFAGDWHGNTRWARIMLSVFADHGITDVIQLGDFGLGWPNGWGQYLNEVDGACIKHKINLRIVPGNHENYDWMEANLETGEDGLQRITDRISVFPRGYRGHLGERSFVALGGAPSIDFTMRRQGVSWWKQEMITEEDVDNVITGGYADIMLAHDAPDGGTPQVQRIIDDPNGPMNWPSAGLAYAKRGRMRMNRAFEGVKPRVFIHGHFHVAGESDNGVHKFISLNCDNFAFNIISLDTETLEHTWLD